MNILRKAVAPVLCLWEVTYCHEQCDRFGQKFAILDFSAFLPFYLRGHLLIGIILNLQYKFYTSFWQIFIALNGQIINN